jgi:hypothetical protein
LDRFRAREFELFRAIGVRDAYVETVDGSLRAINIIGDENVTLDFACSGHIAATIDIFRNDSGTSEVASNLNMTVKEASEPASLCGKTDARPAFSEDSHPTLANPVDAACGSALTMNAVSGPTEAYDADTTLLT